MDNTLYNVSFDKLIDCYDVECNRTGMNQQGNLPSFYLTREIVIPSPRQGWTSLLLYATQAKVQRIVVFRPCWFSKHREGNAIRWATVIVSVFSPPWNPALQNPTATRNREMYPGSILGTEDRYSKALFTEWNLIHEFIQTRIWHVGIETNATVSPFTINISLSQISSLCSDEDENRSQPTQSKGDLKYHMQTWIYYQLLCYAVLCYAMLWSSLT